MKSARALGIRLSPAILVLVVLAGQALLLFDHLDLLDAWGDELFTRYVVAHRISEIIPIVQADVHPPLYYFLLHEWSKIPLPWTGIASLRAFSVIMTMLCTVLLDCFWLRRWRTAHRSLGLVLFAFSPCLLLYGRMARSYAMQTVVAMLAVYLLSCWIEEPRRLLARALPACAAVVLLLYTHYLPGIVILAGFALTGWRRLGTPRVVLSVLACLAAYAPWIPTLARSLHSWGSVAGFQSHYHLTPGPVAEQLFTITFALVSLTIGETFAPLTLLLVPLILWMAWRGWRIRTLRPSLLPLTAVAALIAYIGAVGWVSWPFVPARLLWLLPFATLSLTIGLLRSRRTVRYGLTAAIFLSFAVSGIYYFRRENFVNMGYAAPLHEMADRVRANASSHDVVLSDGYNADSEAIRYYLGSGITFAAVSPWSLGRARAVAGASGVRAVWFVRSTRDVTPGHVITAVEADACQGRARSETFYEPFPAWERAAMRLVTGQPAPAYFYQITACR